MTATSVPFSSRVVWSAMDDPRVGLGPHTSKAGGRLNSIDVGLWQKVLCSRVYNSAPAGVRQARWNLAGNQLGVIFFVSGKLSGSSTRGCQVCCKEGNNFQTDL